MAVHWRGRASHVEIWGNWDNWERPVSLIQSQHAWRAVLSPQVYGTPIMRSDIHFKFVIDGKWQTFSGYPIVADGNGIQNNFISAQSQSIPVPVGRLNESVGIAKARGILNLIHRFMDEQAFDEIDVQWPCEDFSIIERHSRDRGKALYFFIRSAWSKASDRPSRHNVSSVINKDRTNSVGIRTRENSPECFVM